MDFTVISSPRAAHQVSHQAALAEGLKSHGINPILTIGNYARTKHVACWGWRLGKALRAAGHEVLVMERGYLGDRFEWSSLAWNGLNGRGEFGKAPEDSSRFADNFTMQPWKQGGDYILIMGQVPGDASLQGRDMMPWYEQAAREAADKYGLPVQFRAHPLAARKGHRQKLRNATQSTGELSDALAGAAVVVTFNSNSGVDSVLAGVPTVAVDQGSMAWDVTGRSIGDCVTPERDAWASRLAWCQWRLDEISSGAALNGLIEVMNGWLN